MRKILQAVLVASALLLPTVATAQPSGDQRGQTETWQAHREANGDLFRRPAYTPPPGERYRRTSVGANLAPPFYGRSYRIANYGDYRLPSPTAGHQYIRHGNDVVLVKLSSGRVKAVIPDFFL